VTSSRGWSRPPLVATLESDEVALWLFRADARRSIETVVGRYLGLSPSSVVLRRSATGKPELDGSPLCVSLAHSGQVAIVAVAEEREVGVDIERLRAGTESWSLVSHALTQAERARLEALPRSRRSEAFLWMWAGKEALLKAVGIGLGLDPALIELDGAEVVATPPALGAPDDWTLVEVPLPGYAAALALKGPPPKLRLYDTRLPAESRACGDERSTKRRERCDEFQSET
jgi:4'-phosphopantetheinyl transferase